jgi:hypothetical protein
MPVASDLAIKSCPAICFCGARLHLAKQDIIRWKKKRNREEDDGDNGGDNGINVGDNSNIEEDNGNNGEGDGDSDEDEDAEQYYIGLDPVAMAVLEEGYRTMCP